MKPAFESQMLLVPPNWKHRKLAGNRPATSSAKLTWIATLASLVAAAPPARAIAVLGLERSIVVYARRPSIVPIEHEFGPSGKNSESFGNEYWPCAQMPYWPPCCSGATPLQFAQLEPELTLAALTVGDAFRTLFS